MPGHRKGDRRAKRVHIPPPRVLDDYGPSALMRYFLSAGGWTYAELVEDVSARHKTNTISLDTMVNWANHDVEPTIYRPAFLRLIDDAVAEPMVDIWRMAFLSVWAEHRARPRKRTGNVNTAPRPPRAG